MVCERSSVYCMCVCVVWYCGGRNEFNSVGLHITWVLYPVRSGSQTQSHVVRQSRFYTQIRRGGSPYRGLGSLFDALPLVNTAIVVFIHTRTTSSPIISDKGDGSARRGVAHHEVTTIATPWLLLERCEQPG